MRATPLVTRRDDLPGRDLADPAAIGTAPVVVATVAFRPAARPRRRPPEPPHNTRRNPTRMANPAAIRAMPATVIPFHVVTS
jgi:hypothetical protein